MLLLCVLSHSDTTRTPETLNFVKAEFRRRPTELFPEAFIKIVVKGKQKGLPIYVGKESRKKNVRQEIKKQGVGAL